ncbi:hypothetical protein AB0B10_25675 [Micromonospora arborensis]|uniref:hypothetical protein n=1 Tax=Micromonospora arborensis TaxID=2116518 RepID=UPI0033E45008
MNIRYQLPFRPHPKSHFYGVGTEFTTIGYDANRATFFAQVAVQHENMVRGSMVRRGGEPYEIRSAQEAVDLIALWSHVPPGLAARLEVDAGPIEKRTATDSSSEVVNELGHHCLLIDLTGDPDDSFSTEERAKWLTILTELAGELERPDGYLFRDGDQDLRRRAVAAAATVRDYAEMVRSGESNSRHEAELVNSAAIQGAAGRGVRTYGRMENYAASRLMERGILALVRIPEAYPELTVTGFAPHHRSAMASLAPDGLARRTASAFPDLRGVRPLASQPTPPPPRGAPGPARSR